MKNYLNEQNGTRHYLRSKALPDNDTVNDQFAGEFSAGGHYGIELSSMNNPAILSQAMKLADRYGVPVSRAIECRGIMRLPDDDIREMVAICREREMGLVLAIGPRAISDIGSFVKSPNGTRLGYRLRGMDNVVYAIEDIKRAIELGVRGFLIYDEGLLWLLHQMRKEGQLPSNLMFKYSVHAGCANPLSAKLLTDIGADTINVIPDLEIGMLAGFRRATSVPIDVFSDTAKSAGGLIRTYHMPEMIRCASPLYLKCGPVSQPEQNHLPSATELEERVKQARNVYEHVLRYLPEAKLVNKNEVSLGLTGTALSFTEGGCLHSVNEILEKVAVSA